MILYFSLIALIWCILLGTLQFSAVGADAVSSSILIQTSKKQLASESVVATADASATDDIPDESPEEIMNWLRQQQVEVSMAQTNLVQKLRDFGIPVGMPPGSLLQQHQDQNMDDLHNRVITSTHDNQIECRITLGRAQIGKKCVAPCQCTGSQKWVQFSVLNKLRRKDPRAWITCPTCRTPYRYDLLVAKSDLRTSLLSAVLDNLVVLRSFLAITLLSTAVIAGVPNSILRFLVSRFFWQRFSQWSKITHLPLAMKIWVGKLVVTELCDRYVRFEKEYLIEALSNIETEWLESSLVSPNDPVRDRDDDADNEEEVAQDYEDEEVELRTEDENYEAEGEEEAQELEEVDE